MSFFGNVPYYYQVVRGDIAGESIEFVQGSNPKVDLGASENLWDLGGTLVYPTANEQWEMISDNPNDTALGSGAREILLTYLDENYVRQTQTLATNGGTVTIPGVDKFRGIQAKVTQAGSALKNLGLITFKVAGGGADRLGITQGGNKSLHGFFTLPANQRGFLIYAVSTIGKGKDAEVITETTDGTDGLFVSQVPTEIYQSQVTVNSTAPIPLIPRTDLRFVCITQNNNTRVNATLQIHLVDL